MCINAVLVRLLWINKLRSLARQRRRDDGQNGVGIEKRVQSSGKKSIDPTIDKRKGVKKRIYRRRGRATSIMCIS